MGRLFLLGIILVADEGYESALFQVHDQGLTVLLPHELQVLSVPRSDRCKHAPPLAQLREQFWRNSRRCRRYDDGIEWGSLGKALAAVSNDERDVAISEAIEDVLGSLGQSRKSFH